MTSPAAGSERWRETTILSALWTTSLITEPLEVRLFSVLLGSSKSRSLSRILSESRKSCIFWSPYKQQVTTDSFARTYPRNSPKHGPISLDSQNRATWPPFLKALGSALDSSLLAYFNENRREKLPCQSWRCVFWVLYTIFFPNNFGSTARRLSTTISTWQQSSCSCLVENPLKFIINGTHLWTIMASFLIIFPPTRSGKKPTKKRLFSFMACYSE